MMRDDFLVAVDMATDRPVASLVGLYTCAGRILAKTSSGWVVVW
jgi:hypothetical protein